MKGNKRIVCLFFISICAIAFSVELKPSSSYFKGTSPANPSVQPISRQSSFVYANRTVSTYPLINSSSQKSAPSNSSLLEEMVGLTTVEPEAWRSFSIGEPEVFLAVDGGSQSQVLRVLIEVLEPDLSIAKTQNTSSSTPFHFLVLSPSIGTWQVHLKLVDSGNTTAWIQVKSYNEGAKIVTDYQKERVHLYAGQTLYLRLPVATGDWFDVYCVKLAGSTVRYELHKPLQYDSVWSTQTNTFDGFYSAQNLPATGVYLLVITNEGSADVMVQVTLPTGIYSILTPNDHFVMGFSLDYENEHFYIEVSTALSWLAMDGAMTNAGSWVRYRLIGPDMNMITDQTSNSMNSYVTKLLANPAQGRYILILRASAQSLATVQLKTSGNEDGILTNTMDEKLAFSLSGQTAYYSVQPNVGVHFLYVGTSLNSTRSQYRVFNFRAEQTWSYSSNGPTQVGYTAITSGGGYYLLQVQGFKDSSVMLHFRIEGQEDFSLATPDYSDFNLRFTGDIIFCKVQVRTSSYFTQYWHSLNNSYLAAWTSNPSYQSMGSSSLNDANGESRLVWTKNDASFAAGTWAMLITGMAGGIGRVSQLQAGDEERITNTPFQFFESFDFDFQAKCLQVNVPPCTWFAIVPRIQIDSTCHMRGFDSELASKADISLRNRDSNQFGYWKNPKTGGWIIVIDGSLNGNMSLSFFSSTDSALTRSPETYYTEEFEYYGEARHYNLNIVNASFLGLDDMCLSENLATYLYLINPLGDIPYSITAATKFNANHYFVNSPGNGTWYVVIIGTLKSSIVYRYATSPDEVEPLPFSDRFGSEFDGKATYAVFNVTGIDTVILNFTSITDSDTWLWLHDPTGYVRYQYRFTKRDEFRQYTYSKPASGNWYICVVQEVFANITVVCSGTIPPPPKPSGVLITFVYPPDAQLYLIGNNVTVLPEVNGTINVVVNVTDYYHQISEVLLYYNGGINHTSMAYDTVSQFYECLFDTTAFPDGLYELITSARCSASEMGVGSIAVRLNNQGTYPTIDDATAPMIQNVRQDPSKDVPPNEKVTVRVDVADRDTAVALVLLGYSTNNGQTWKNVTMYPADKLTYEAFIPGFLGGTKVLYQLIAYDFVQNCAVDSQAGEYYVYNVVPEFSIYFLVLLLASSTSLIVAFNKHMHRLL